MWILKYFIQHCFICRPSDSTMLEDAGIELWTVAKLSLAFRRSNRSARSQNRILAVLKNLKQLKQPILLFPSSSYLFASKLSPSLKFSAAALYSLESNCTFFNFLLPTFSSSTILFSTSSHFRSIYL